MERQKTDFISYEYKEIIVDSDKASIWLDAFENFGWEIDNRTNSLPDINVPRPGAKAVLHLKRNRKIVNKAELTRLQRNFEASMKEIDILEKSKTSKATIYSLICGMIGCAFMAGSVFAVTATPPHYILMTILAIPGIAAWSISYFVYKKTVAKQTGKMNQLIEQKYDEIYGLCEKGSQL